MIFLPIVFRELRTAARRKRTYTARFGAIFAAIAFGCYLMFVSSMMLGRAQGGMMFTSLVGLGFLSCLSLAANTVDCISEEKREGTLGFLFLTDLKGHDITLGKLVSRSLVSFYSLLGILPIVAISLLFGGVSATEFWAAALALLNVFFFAQSAGIFVSAFSRKRNSATAAAALILLGYSAGFYLFSYAFEYWKFNGVASLLQWFNLTYSVYWACTMGANPAGPYASQFGHYWASLLFFHLQAWLLLAVASWWIPRSWQEKASTKTVPWKERFLRRFHERHTPRALLLDRNPFLWLSVRNRFGSQKIWAVLLGINGFWFWLLCRTSLNDDGVPVLIATILSNHLSLKVFVAADAAGNLEEQRHSGALEYLLSCTPLTTGDILAGQWLALRRHLLRPIIAVLLADFAITAVILVHHGQSMDAKDKGQFAMFVLAVIAMLIADIITLGWVAMWSGMTQRKQRHAAGRALAQILILPWVFLILVQSMSAFTRAPVINSFGAVIGTWFFTGIFVDGMAGTWAYTKLMAEFRTRAAMPLEDEPGFFARMGRTLGMMARPKI